MDVDTLGRDELAVLRQEAGDASGPCAPAACTLPGSGFAKGPPRLALPDGAAGEARFWAWRDSVAALWDVAVEDVEAARRFGVSSEAYHLGTSIVARLAASAHRVRRTSTIIARMGVDHVLLHLQQRGAQVVEAGGARVTAGPGDICFLDTSRTYAAQSSDQGAVMLVLPRNLFVPFLHGREPPHGLVLRATEPLGRLLAMHIAALAEATPLLCPMDAAAAGAGTASLAAACCGPGLSLLEDPASPAAPAVLLTIRRHIETNLDAADMTAEGLTARFALSRSALYRLFEPFGGVADYVRRRRLARAYADLAGSGSQRVRQRITDVSQRYGFESDAVFSRAFRREFGIAPREVQSLAGEQQPRSDSGDPGTVLRDWVARLCR